jgi:hypothetical protein
MIATASLHPAQVRDRENTVGVAMLHEEQRLDPSRVSWASSLRGVQASDGLAAAQVGYLRHVQTRVRRPT